MRNEFLDRGISCEVVHGKMNSSLRAETLKKFSTGEISVLTNCNLLTEGYDEPSVGVLLMARPTCSKTLYVQMIGRGLRKFENKTTCKVIEFTDNDFDVCSLEDLLQTPQKRICINNSESLKAYNKRVENVLLEGSVETVILPHNLILKTSFSNRLASPWQICELKRRNIEFVEPLFEITANYLLNKEA